MKAVSLPHEDSPARRRPPLPPVPPQAPRVACGWRIFPARLMAAYEHGTFRGSWRTNPSCGGPRRRVACPRVEGDQSMRNVSTVDRFASPWTDALRRWCGNVNKPRVTAKARGSPTTSWTHTWRCTTWRGLGRGLARRRTRVACTGFLGTDVFGSMFSTQSNASKVAFIQLVRWLALNGFGPVGAKS